MPTSYSGDPRTSPTDAVRFLVGDTDTINFQLTDEEIEATLEQTAQDVDAAAITCAEILAARYSLKADRTIGDLSISYSQIGKSYQALATRLRTTFHLANLPAPVKTAEVREAKFKIGMHDN